jgi:rare lipoprotein A
MIYWLLLVLAASVSAGTASWYGEEHRGRLTANGERFNPDHLTCASWHHPFGTKLRVTNQRNGKSVVVVVTDRGPARRLRREIDLSAAAFRSIEDPRRGLTQVRVKRIR